MREKRDHTLDGCVAERRGPFLENLLLRLPFLGFQEPSSHAVSLSIPGGPTPLSCGDRCGDSHVSRGTAPAPPVRMTVSGSPWDTLQGVVSCCPLGFS